MVRMCVTLSEKDLEHFEHGREAVGMNKSSYIRLLIAEHEKRVPAFWKNKDLIEEISKLNTSVNSLIISDKIEDHEKLYLHEQIKKLNEKLKNVASA